MAWPMSQDFNEAIQFPAACFEDAELRQGTVVVNKLGLPLPRSGNFADVYAVSAGDRKWAVKCFTRQIPGLRDRYLEISKYLAQVQLPFMVEFKFLEQGIKVRGQWYPVLRMDWVEGFALNEFVKDHVSEPQVLGTLCQIWVKLAARLREANLAHCDVQHGNILLVPAAKAATLSVRLVDYDGMWVPALELLKSIELGHPNYQHPQRLRETIWSPRIDRFAHLIIYTALRALIVGGRPMWDRYDNGDNLLFKQADFEAPTRSPLFADLLRSNHPEVRPLAEALIQALRVPLDHVPLLEDQIRTPMPASPGRRTAVQAPLQPSIVPAPAGRYVRRRRTPAGRVAAILVAVLVGLAGALVLLVSREGSRTADRQPPIAQGNLDTEHRETGQSSPPSRPATTRPRTFLVRPTTTKSTSLPEDPKTTPDVTPKLRFIAMPTMQLEQHGWARGAANVQMLDNDLGFCFLSALSGCFAGDGEEVKVTVEEGRWQLVGRTQKPLTGGATSLRGPERRLFEAEVKEYTWKPGNPPLPLLPREDGFCFLSGVGGGFIGDGEEVGVFLAPDRQWYLHGRAGTPIWGKALVVRTKQAGVFRARIREHAWTAGNPPMKMIRRTDGFCVLASVGGGFRGAGEEVKVYLGEDDYWYLGGRSGGPRLHARAISIDLVTDAAPPAPVPAIEEQRKAEKLIRSLFNDEFAKTKPTDQLALADKLLEQATATKDDPAARYVLYRDALDLTANAADPAMACQIASLLATKYAVKAPDLKATALAKAAKATGLAGKPTLLQTALLVLDEAVRDDDFRAAAKLLELAEATASELKVKQLSAAVQTWKDRLDPLQKAYAAACDAEATLNRDPADAKANGAFGKYQCFWKGKWDRGLPRLARADDQNLRELAGKDLARPQQAEQQAAVGDGWWALAEADEEGSPVRTELLRRSLYWYRQAAPGLTGLSRTKVDTRLAQLGKNPALEPPSRFVILPLDKVATAVSTKPMFNNLPNDTLALPTWGAQEVYKVPFVVTDPKQGVVRNAIVLHGPMGTVSRKMPQTVRVPCQASAGVIHMLGGVSGWGFPTVGEKSVSLTVRLHYENGLVEDHPLVNGLHLADYGAHIEVPESRLAYKNAHKQIRYLSITPKRLTPIKEIEFIKGKDNTAPVVLGITIEKPDWTGR
ncbi:MAG: hypothetical protein K2R98_26510 [Gemmataceae bacterium]|nr:hypothetical protein [Gemmataceae bacterium]